MTIAITIAATIIAMIIAGMISMRFMDWQTFPVCSKCKKRGKMHSTSKKGIYVSYFECPQCGRMLI